MALDTETLKKRLAGQQWTSQNIRLNDDVSTWPSHYEFIALDGRVKAVERMLRLTFGPSLNELRVADLGALEGGFSLALALRGADVTGVEARQANYAKLALLEEHFALPNLKFVLADVKDFTQSRFGVFDAVLALGILYHLDSPVEWLRQISAATKRIVIIDTHFAPANSHALGQIDPRIAALSELETVHFANREYQGRWFKEYEPGSSSEDQLWASYSNWQSFWLTKESLLRAVRDAGFDLVLEQHDYSMDSHDRLAIEFPRTMLAGIKL